MTVKHFNLYAALISVLCVIALTFGSCSLSDISQIFSDEPDYSYSLLKSEVSDSILRQEDERTFSCAYDGNIDELMNTVNSDADRLFEEDEYFSYYVKTFTPSYSYNANTVQITCKYTYNSSCVARKNIIDADGGEMQAVYKATEILQTGEQAVAFRSKIGFDDDRIQRILNTVSINSGTAYTFSDYECMYYTKANRKILQLNFISNITEQKRVLLNGELYDAVSRIAKKISAQNKDENKKRLCLAIHNYICENTSYDYDIVPESVKTDEAMIGRSAYGALIDGKSVCSGYASAFLLLYNKIIGDGQCKIAAGTQGEGDDAVGHAWNVVYDDDEEYYIDCTFDDREDGYVFDYFYEPSDSDNFKHHYIDENYIME